VAAYTRGINSWLQEQHALPIELQLLGRKPQPFQPADAVLLVKLLAWQLSGNFIDELWRVRMGAQLTPQQQAEFSVAYPGDPSIPFAQLWQVYSGLGLDALRQPSAQGRHRAAVDARSVHPGQAWLQTLTPVATELAKLAPAHLGEAIGSNNWLVDGSRSATGKPLLANDPHLALSAPSQWYFAHLEAPGLSVIGATLPAVPGVILGRNAHVAWTFTNTHPDTEDVFIERLAPGDPERYLTPHGYQTFERRRELIKVKGGAEVELWVRSTRHGPVISDVSTHARGLTPTGHVLALSWTGLAPDDTTVAFPLRAGRAVNAAELREAARSYHAPTQNIVYADDAGTVGFVAAGKVPVRGPGNALNGLVPAPGWLADYDWRRLLAFEEMPALQAAQSGRIVTANQNIVPPGFARWLGADWGPPYRHDRITQLLDARAAHSLDSFAEIQRDNYSTIAAQLLPTLIEQLGAPRDDAERSFVAELSAWDRAMRPDSRAPLLFAAWLRELTKLIAQDELGELLSEDAWVRPEFLRAVLDDRAGQARWCDDTRSPEQEGCEYITRRALHGALAYLNRRFGDDRSKWSWGVAHPSVSAHAVLGKVPVLNRFFDVTAERGGDSSTVDVGSYQLEDDDTAFRNAWGPGFRAIYDLADLERSVAILNTGESGHVMSAHYRDMNALWSRGQYVPLITDRARVMQHALGTWVLDPR